jgi:hypothetical protein
MQPASCIDEVEDTGSFVCPQSSGERIAIAQIHVARWNNVRARFRTRLFFEDRLTE